MIIIKQAEELAAAQAASKGPAQNDSDGVRNEIIFSTIIFFLN